LSATCEDGALTVLTFVANRSSERYLGKAGLDQIAQLVRTGKGTLGTSRDYFESSLHSLLALGVTDAGMERLRLAVLQADENAAARQ
jgi:cation transport protein ChaC